MNATVGKRTLLLSLVAVAVSTAGCAAAVSPTRSPVATTRDSPAWSSDPAISSPVASRAAEDPLLAELRDRPPILPKVGVMDGCPVSSPQRINGTAVSALGSEPLYAGGLSHTSNWNEATTIDGARYIEVTWLSEPHYLRSLLVEGANLTTGAPIEFRTPDGVLDEELYLTTATSSEGTPGPGFREWVVQIQIPERGCYGMQVEAGGHIGGYIIVFEVT